MKSSRSNRSSCSQHRSLSKQSMRSVLKERGVGGGVVQLPSLEKTMAHLRNFSTANLREEACNTGTDFKAANKSARSLSRQNTSRLTHRSQPADLSLKLSKLTLSDLSLRVDELLKHKIELLTSQEKEEQLENQLLGQINSELGEVLQQIKSRNLTPEETKTAMLDKKIEIVEKIIAENYSEAELIKYYFASYANSRTEYKKLGGSPSKALETILTKIPHYISALANSTSQSVNSSFKFESTKQKDFQAYPADLYKINALNKRKYVKNRSPFQTSHYQSTFIAYPSMAVNLGKPSDVTHCQRHYSPIQMMSSYTDTYKNLTGSKPANFKGLDCVKDKFRNLQIDFSRKSSVLPSSKIGRTIGILERDYSKSRLVHKPLACKGFQGQFVSEATREFSSYVDNFKATPSHKRLEAFKHQFKNLRLLR